MKGLDALLLLGDIDELTRNSILEFSNMVNTQLARNYAMVRKGAEDIMGGKILEYEAKTIFQNGIRFGREEGREEERLANENKLIASAKKMVNAGIDVDLVCSTLGVDKSILLQNVNS